MFENYSKKFNEVAERVIDRGRKFDIPDDIRREGRMFEAYSVRVMMLSGKRGLFLYEYPEACWELSFSKFERGVISPDIFRLMSDFDTLIFVDGSSGEETIYTDEELARNTVEPEHRVQWESFLQVHAELGL